MTWLKDEHDEISMLKKSSWWGEKVLVGIQKIKIVYYDKCYNRDTEGKISNSIWSKVGRGQFSRVLKGK